MTLSAQPIYKLHVKLWTHLQETRMLRRLLGLIQVAAVGKMAMATAILRQRVRVDKASEAGAVTQMIPL